MTSPLQTTMFNGVSQFYNAAISTSMRFDDADTVNLNLTSSQAPTSTALATFSCWVKRGSLNAACTIFGTDGSGTSGDNASWIQFSSANVLDFANVTGGTYTGRQRTTMKFRDTSSWYHIVVRIDLANSTAANRVRIYVNGSLTESAFVQDSGAPAAWASNGAMQLTTAVTSARIGAVGYATANPYDGYLADVNLVDGASLAPASFGETKNGIWIPITPSVTYGNCGFRLQFLLQGTSQNAAGMGADTSGNNRHFAKSSGNVASDSAMPDCPEINFCTLNPLILTPQTLFSEGNLFANLGATHKTVHGTFGMTTGKWYWEARAFDGGANKFTYGLTDTRNVSNLQVSGTNYLLANTSTTYANGDAVSIYAGSLYKNGSATGSYDTAVVDNDIVGIAFDADAGKVWFHREGTWINSDATASTTINLSKHDTTVTTGQTYHLAFAGETSDWLLNAGQDSSFTGTETAQGNTDGNGKGDFYYAPPSGFLAVCSSNLPESTIGPNSLTQADEYFNTVLYTGNGQTAAQGSNAISGVGFQPDWVWLKKRDSAGANVDHALYDSTRGINAAVFSSSSGAESTFSNQFKSFDSDGFTVALADDTSFGLNRNSSPFISWNWKANGGTTATNTEGSTQTTIQVNQTAGFSIITYTGNATAGATIGHGLGAVPKWILVKSRSLGSTSWLVYHGEIASDPQTDAILLDSTGGVSDSALFWNDTAPSSTLITLGGAYNPVNGNNATYVAYAFAEVEGYSKFGSYTGNGSANGAFVFTGFRPVFVIMKRTNANGNSWGMKDTVRDSTNPNNGYLFAESSGAEGTATSLDLDFLSNGLKFRGTSGDGNANGGAYIYMAFAEAPFKYANAR